MKHQNQRNGMCDVNLSDSDMVEMLQQENEILKQQLDKALELPKELEAQHRKTKELSAQLLESNQKIENLQNRLKLSQQKTSECENKQFEYENRIKQMRVELEKSANEKMQLEQEISDLTKQRKNLADTADSANSEQQKFLAQISAVCSQNISSYAQVIDAVKSIQEITRKQAEGNSQIKEVQKTVQKQAKRIKKLKDAISQLIEEKEEYTEEKGKLQENVSAVACEAKTKINQLTNMLNEQKKEITDLMEQLKAKDEEIAKEQDNTAKANADKQIEKTKYDQLLAERNQRIAELKERLSTPVVHDNEERNKLIEEISQKNHENEQILETIKQQATLIKELEGKVKACIGQCQKLQIQKERAKQKYQHANEHIADLEKTVACMKLEQDSNFAKQNSNSIELESLRMQLQAAEISHKQGATAFEMQKQEIEKLKRSLDMVEATIKDLRKEKDSLHEQKIQLVSAIKKQSLLINQLEKIAKESTDAEEDAKKKLKAMVDKQNDPYSNPQILQVVSQNLIPHFNEPLRSRLNSVLTGTIGSPLLKANNVFRAIAEAFTASAQPAKEKEEQYQKALKEFDEKKKSFDSVLSLVEGTIQGLSYILRSEKADNEALKCEPGRNSELLDFVAKNIQKLESSIPANYSLDPQFVSMNFLIGGSFEDRRVALQEIATHGWSARTTFDLFCLQIMINSVQEKELQSLRTAFESLHADIDLIQELTGCEDIGTFVDLVNKLSTKLRQAKALNKKLSAYIESFESREDAVKSQEDLIAAYEELQRQSCELEQQIKQFEEDAKNAKSVLRQKDARIQQLEENIAKSETITSEEMQRLRSEISDYEREIDEKNLQIRNLNIQVLQAKSDAEIQIKAVKKQIEEANASASSKQNKLQQMYQQLKEKKKSTEKALVQRFNEQQKAQEEEIANLVKCQSELKFKLNEAIRELRKQSDEKNALSQTLSESLIAAEEKNKEMSGELTRLTVAKKSLEVQIQSLNDQMKREVQLIASQNSFREIAAETKHQEEMASIKSRYDTEKNSLLMQILEDFDALNSLGSADFNEETALEALHKVSEDYKKKKSVY